MKNIIAAQPFDNKLLNVVFDDGASFKVDMRPFIKSGVSQALNDQSYFNRVVVEDGYITWPKGFDFCPEFLYQYAVSHHD